MIALPRGTVIVYAVVALISLAGLADATYLTVQNLAGETAVCRGSLDCFRVLGNVYSKIAGIPVAAIGTVAYFAVFTFATFAAFGYQRARTFLAVTVFMMFLSTLSVAIALFGSNHIFADRLDRRETAAPLAWECSGVSVGFAEYLKSDAVV